MHKTELENSEECLAIKEKAKAILAADPKYNQIRAEVAEIADKIDKLNEEIEELQQHSDCLEDELCDMEVNTISDIAKDPKMTEAVWCIY